MTVNILGTPYEIIVKKYDEDEEFERRSISGFCDGYAKEIVICDMHTYKGWENESEKTIVAAQKQTIRHEIVHAFFNESGLQGSSNVFGDAWTKNEEMIDWIALQAPKLMKAFEEAGCM